MKMLAAIAVSLLLTAVAIWGGSYEQDTWWGEVSQVQPGNSTEQALRVPGLYERALPILEGLREGGGVGVRSSFRSVLGTPFDARRLGAARRFAAEVAEASGAEGVGAAGAGTDRQDLRLLSRAEGDSEPRRLEESPLLLPGDGLDAGLDALDGGIPSQDSVLVGDSPLRGSLVDACPAEAWKMGALRAYGVEWAYDKLRRVEFCESTCIAEPCVVGLADERGPLQFHPVTWGEGWNPYRAGDACDPLTAWHAAGAFIAAGRMNEWTCAGMVE